MDNEKTLPILNEVLRRWVRMEPGLVSNVDCVSCSNSIARPAFAERWRQYKCCTFQPFVAGFYCGAHIVAHGQLPADAESKAVLQPIGVMAAHEYRKRHEQLSEDEHGNEQLCAFYMAGRCQIWSHRPGECSLHFCTQDAGRARREDWKIRSFQLESALSQMALAHLGFGPRELAQQVEWLNEPTPFMPSMKRADVEEIYVASWRWVERQSVSDILTWAGFDNSRTAE